MQADLAGYTAGGTESAAVFGVARSRFGVARPRAIFRAPNNTIVFADVPESRVIVERGPTMDVLVNTISE